jgi:hypothetical protein
MKKGFFILIFSFSYMSVVSCGGNILASLSTKQSLQEQAEVDMQNGNYTDAQTKLQTIIASDPSNYTAVSLLSACFAAEGGIILFQILLNASTNTSLANPSSNPIGFSAALLPTPTVSVLAQILLATNTMASIPAASMTSDMLSQQQMFLDIYMLLQAQSLLATLSAGGTLSAAQVSLLISTISNVNAANSGSSNGLTQAISSVTAGITNAPGGTPTQQVTNYLTPFI